MKEPPFQKLDLFPSSDDGWETPTPLGPLERVNLSPVIEVLFYLICFSILGK
jgi:hypothetical protein